MKTTFISAKELDNALLVLWHKWHAESAPSLNPFLSPTFALTYARHQKHARIGILEEEGEVVGFVPVERAAFGASRFLANGLCDVQSPVFKPGYTPDPDELLSAMGVSVFEFDRFVPEVAEQFRPAGSHRVASPVIDISGGYEAWLAAKRKTSSSRFRRILQRQRQMARELGDVEFTFASTSHADLDELMAWKSAQYVRTGRRDRFAKPWFRNVMHELLEQTNNEYGMVLSKLCAGGNVLAFDLGLRNKSNLAGWFPAYDITYGSYSPGNVCLLMQIEGAANNGITRIDLGVGEADYKESFKNYDDYVVEGWCERRTPAAMLYKASNMPERLATNFVLERPRLRLAARHTLNTVGSVRQRAKTTNRSIRPAIVNSKIGQIVVGGSAAAAEWGTSVQLIPAF